MVQLGLLYISLCLLSLLGQQVNAEWDFYDSEETKSSRNPAETEEQKNQIKTISQQPSCHPVFKRFLNRLLNEVNKFDSPSQPEDGIYDAKIKLSKQAIAEIQSFLEDKDRLTPGALDQAISQILVDVRPHSEEARMWLFEDIIDVEFDTVKKV
uniref:Chloride channel CLIC-like protein 1 n=1 Tax=Oryzias melastigma TaxID=30732 RepID=A0A3B3DJL5_ORYME